MTDSVSTAQRRRVYILCRPIFSGFHAKVRKKNKIQELVDKNKVSLQPLLKDIKQIRIVGILQSLLEKRIFESEARAKIEFPDLFQPSPLRAVQRQAVEVEAAQSTQEVLNSITSHPSEGLDIDDVENRKLDEPSKAVNLMSGKHEVKIPEQPVTEIRPSGHNLSSLYPSYLPYQTQHLIVTTAQQALEECCFYFATATMPVVFQDRRWECPVAVELTEWIKLFREGKNKLPVQTIPIDFTSKEAQGMLTTITHLRHTAVHRLPTTARGISRLLGAAVNLAQTLRDNLRATQLDDLRTDVDLQIKAMELNKNLLEDTVSAGLEEIQRKREELERMEVELFRRMLNDDTDNKTLIGRLLEDSVRRIFRHEKQDKEDEKNEQKNDEREDDRGGAKKDGTKSEQEENEEDHSSGYETPAEERLHDVDQCEQIQDHACLSLRAN